MLGEKITDVFGMNTQLDRMMDIVILEKFDEEAVVCRFTVDESCVNLNGSLHGGYSAMLIDVVSTLAFLARDLTKAGVSVDLNSTYLATCAIGDDIKVVAKVLKMGKTLGFSAVDIIRMKDNVLICTGRHTKAFAQPRQQKKVKEEAVAAAPSVIVVDNTDKQARERAAAAGRALMGKRTKPRRPSADAAAKPATKPAKAKSSSSSSSRARL